MVIVGLPKAVYTKLAALPLRVIVLPKTVAPFISFQELVYPAANKLVGELIKSDGQKSVLIV